MTDTDMLPDPILEPQPNPRRTSVLIAGVHVATIERVADGYLAINRQGKTLAMMTTPQLALAVIVAAVTPTD